MVSTCYSIIVDSRITLTPYLTNTKHIYYQNLFNVHTGNISKQWRIGNKLTGNTNKISVSTLKLMNKNIENNP